MPRLRYGLVGILLILLFTVECFGVLSDSQTIDEGVHLTSGISYWKTGTIALNPEHPPLIKLLAAAPLLFLPIHVPFEHVSWAQSDQWEFARQFLYHNTIQPNTLLFLGRLPIIWLTVGLAFAVFSWSKKWFGFRAGLFSLAFFILDPTVLAHGRLITTDVGVALFFFLSVMLWLAFIEQPSKKRFIVFALAFTAAQLTKFSALILWFIIPLIGVIGLMKRESDPRLSKHLTGRRLLRTLALLVITVGVSTWACYGFELKPASYLPSVQDFYDAESAQLNGQTNDNPVASIPFWENLLRPDQEPGKIIHTLATTVPLPATHYFQGVVDLSLHNYYGHGTYLLGQPSVKGWWYYFPVAFYVKTPLAVQMLIGLALLLALAEKIRSRRSRLDMPADLIRSHQVQRPITMRAFVLILPPLVYLLWSMTSHINLGIRHLIPILPFGYVGLGFLFSHRLFRTNFGTVLVSGFLASALSVAVMTYPNELSYFSETVGGARNGPNYLLDSNLDWSQGFLALHDYVKREKPSPLYGAFFSSIDLPALGLSWRPIQTDTEVRLRGPLPGTYAISAGILFDPTMPYGWLRQYVPRRVFRESIFLYQLP